MLKLVIGVAAVLSVGLPGCFAQETGTPPTPAQMTTMFGQLQTDGVTSKALVDLLADSPNGYVFALQSLLKDKSLYGGTINGTLTRATIRAVNRFCAEQNIESACQAGPLSLTGALALSNAFAAPAVATAEPAATPEPSVEPEQTANAEPQSKPAPEPDEAPSPQATPAPSADASTAAAVLPLQDGTSLAGWTTNLGKSTLVDGRFRVTSDSPKFAGRQFIAFPTKIGKHYRVNAEGYAGSAGATLAVGNSSNIGGAILVSPALDGDYSESFVATANLTYILLAATSSVGGFADFDNVTVSAD